MYKLLKSFDGSTCVQLDCGEGRMLVIPFDPANTDYQEYLKWVAEGNQPLPADTPEE